MEKKCEWGKKSAMDSVLTSLQFYASVWIRRPENESENFGGKGRWYVKLPGTGNDPVCYEMCIRDRRMETKMLFPMFLLLGLVMAIVMIPAFMSM